MSLILNTIQYILYSCNDPKLSFGYSLKYLQREADLGKRIVFWLLLYRRTNQVILDEILYANTNALGKQDFQVALDFETKLEDTLESSSELSERISNFLMACASDAMIYKKAK